jgi:hypothetical protein
VVTAIFGACIVWRERRSLPRVPVVFVGYGYILCFVDCLAGNLLDIKYNYSYT